MPHEPGAGFDDIPLVSLAGWSAPGADRLAFAEDFCRVCHEVGFLLLTDHGVSEEFIDDFFGLQRRFFDLTENVKATIDKRRSRHFRGWERVGAEMTNGRIDHREQFDAWSAHPAHDADVSPMFLRLEGPNQWLAEQALPGFRSAVEAFFTKMGCVAETLMEVLSVGLGLAPGHLQERFGERPFCHVKMVDYPATPPGECGVNEHHDAGFITILAQNGVAGLQAKNPDGEWIEVPPVRGTFAVNLGEMLQAMTGKYVVATTHRVVTSEPRMSAAYFHGPDLRSTLEPLDLDPRFAEMVAASPRHVNAGWMRRRDDLLAGHTDIGAPKLADVFGQLQWNYQMRSYPDNVRAHYPDAFAEVS